MTEENNAEWQPIGTAPKDGTTVLVVVRPYSFHPNVRATQQELKMQEIALAKFSTWDGVWRRVPDGELFKGEKWMSPHLWRPIPEVEYVNY